MPSIVKKHRQRTIDKMHLLIRAELLNPSLSATEIAAMCGLTLWKFSVLKATPMYKQIHQLYMGTLLGGMDKEIQTSLGISQARTTMNIAVPLAMQTLLGQLIQTKDGRLRNKAANDVLDRHGSFVKLTRQTLTVDDNRGVAEERDNKAVLEMIEALNKANNVPTDTSTPNPPALTIDSPVVSEKTQ